MVHTRPSATGHSAHNVHTVKKSLALHAHSKLESNKLVWALPLCDQSDILICPRRTIIPRRTCYIRQCLLSLSSSTTSAALTISVSILLSIQKVAHALAIVALSPGQRLAPRCKTFDNLANYLRCKRPPMHAHGNTTTPHDDYHAKRLHFKTHCHICALLSVAVILYTCIPRYTFR
jgi:hypothetical protein